VVLITAGSGVVLITAVINRRLARSGQAAASSRTARSVYGWFTEGFDTLDLKEAKALLGELA
jgi:hypothetical protein